MEKEIRYVYAYDPIIDERVIHVVNGNIAISLITENKIKYPVKGEKSFTKNERKKYVFERIKRELQN